MEFLACLICYIFSTAMLAATAWSFVPVKVAASATGEPVGEPEARVETQAPEGYDITCPSLYYQRQRATSFNCLCGKSYREAAKYLAHQDKCWAWGHYDGLRLTRNKLGGYQAKGDRFIIPKNGSGKVTDNGKNACPMPAMPSYDSKWVQHTSPICGKAWVETHKDTELPESNLRIEFNGNGDKLSLTDLEDLYPKMARRFGGIIKIV